jgi:hypothetical protein
LSVSRDREHLQLKLKSHFNASWNGFLTWVIEEAMSTGIRVPACGMEMSSGALPRFNVKT